MERRRANKGAVLVMALLIVAAVSSLAVSFASSFQLSLARGENRWHGAQANAYLLGAESLGIAVLKFDAQEDSRKNKDVDSSDEIWAREEQAFPIEGGWVKAKLEDAQGRFNLNNLSGRASPPPGDTSIAARFTEDQRRFIRLLQIFEEVPLTQAEAVAVTEAVIDWLDSDDQETGFNGAESTFYGQRDIPYAPANGLFTSASELRLIRHITPELYQALLPLVVVLPKDEPLNINTALVPVLRSLQAINDLSPLSVDDAERLVSSRPNEGYETVEEFAESDAMRSSLTGSGNMETSGLDVGSRYFLVHAETQLVQQRRRLTSLLKRETKDQIYAVWRRDF